MPVNDPHRIFNSLVSKKLSGEISAEELVLFNEALSQDPDLKIQLKAFKKIWDGLDGMAEQQRYNLDVEWDTLQGKIPEFPGSQTLSGKGRSFLYYTYRVAAVLLIGILISFAWIFATQRVGIQVMEAGLDRMEIILEDGTKILLNRESKIRYSKHFAEGNREISLTGEAWFDVARDTTRPFVIDAGRAMVEVLGTSFNVNAYKKNPGIEITVESGVVAVTAKETGEDQIILRAGNSGSYNRENQEMELVPVYNPNNLSWKTRELIFEDTPLQEVADLIGKVYNVKVLIPRAELAACRITVTFKEQSLESVLNVLEMTLDFEISRSGEDFIFCGTSCIE